jgi:hypothetical protein
VALGANAQAEEISVGATALRAGADAATISRIAAAERGNSSLLVSLSVLSDLVNDRVAVATAERYVTRLAAAGARDADLTGFGKAVRDDIRNLGAVPTDAAVTRGEAAITKGFTTATDALKNGPGPRASGRPPIPPEN